MTASVPRHTRATADQMKHRHDRLVELAAEHQPCSVRHLFYRAVVDGMPGITKTRNGYMKVQRAVLELRRDGRLPYSWIVDNSRTVFRSNSWSSVDDFLADVATLYRRDLWATNPYSVEVWAESDSIAGTLSDLTRRWCVDLFPTRGQSSETFAHNAAAQWRVDPRRVRVVLYVGDHDPAGLEIERSLRDKLCAFADDLEYPVQWRRVGVTWGQAEELDLPGTTPKKKYGFPLAVEAEALPPDLLRSLVDEAIREYVDLDLVGRLEAVEREERDLLASLPGGAR